VFRGRVLSQSRPAGPLGPCGSRRVQKSRRTTREHVTCSRGVLRVRRRKQKQQKQVSRTSVTSLVSSSVPWSPHSVPRHLHRESDNRALWCVRPSAVADDSADATPGLLGRKSLTITRLSDSRFRSLGTECGGCFPASLVMATRRLRSAQPSPSRRRVPRRRPPVSCLDGSPPHWSFGGVDRPFPLAARSGRVHRRPARFRPARVPPAQSGWHAPCGASSDAWAASPPPTRRGTSGRPRRVSAASLQPSLPAQLDIQPL